MRLISSFLLLASFLPTSAALAGHPEMARYEDTPDEVFWFIHISDSHIDNFLYSGEEDQFRFMASEVVDVIQPYFIVNTGDLVDHTDGINYLTLDNTEEWLLYRSLLSEAGIGPDLYFDIPGNHDFYGNDGSFYLTYSVQGELHGTTQPQWVLDLPFGIYHFVGVATPHNDATPAPWPFDNKTFTDAELEEIEANLFSHTDASLTFVFGHHDLEATGNGDRLRTLMQDHGAAHYAHGHEHDLGTRVGDGIVRFRCHALGQAGVQNICIWAVDTDAVSVTTTDVRDPWPAVLVTAPVQARLDGVDNPWAVPVPNTCANAPFRALVFDATNVTEAWFTIDDGTLNPLTRSTTILQQWAGSFDATGLEPGVHSIDVQVQSDDWHHFSSTFLVADLPCDIEPEPEPDDVEPLPEIDETEPPVEPPPDATTDPETDTHEDADLDTEDDTAGASTTAGGCGCNLVH